jgi:peroxiredoxin
MVLLSIDIGEPRSVVEDFIDRHATKYPVLLDDEAKAASAYQVTGVPTFILISKDAEIISVTNDLPSNYKELLTR